MLSGDGHRCTVLHMSSLGLLAQEASRTLDPPARTPPGLFVPFLAIVVVILVVVAVAAWMRARNTDT